MELFDNLQADEYQAVKYMIVLLRLAVLLNRDRIDIDFPIISVSVHENEITLEFEEGWIEQSPLTKIDLEQEGDYLKAMDIKLSF